MMRQMSILTVLVVFIFACEEKSDIEWKTQTTDLVVVDGILTTEVKTHKIKLTWPVKDLNEVPKPVSGATVTIIEGGTFIKLLEIPFGSGEYYTPVMRATSGRTYSATVFYKGDSFTAQDDIVAVEPLEPIRYHAVDNGYELDFHESGQNANFIEYNISWENTSSCTGSNCNARLIYYDLKTADVNEIFKPEKEPFNIPKGSTIIRRKFSVSDSYRSFLRAMLSETEWRGGVFDVQRENVPTNFSEGALGFFAVSTVVSDTTVVP